MRGRELHPGAWWLWSLGLALLASRTSNPVLLGLIIGVCAFVAVTCRRPSPWSRTFAVFVKIGVATIVLRVVVQAVAGLPSGDHVLLTLPQAHLPPFFAGIRLGGTVTTESLATAAIDGARVLAMLCCFGVANVATTPSRLVKALPAALYEIGLVVTVAVSLAPYTVANISRVRAARRLRGRPTRGLAGVRGIALPVLVGAMEQSLALAAAMDSRGYGRRTELSPSRRTAVGLGGAAGMVALGTGAYGLLSGPSWLGGPSFALGVVLLTVALVVGGSRSPRTRYRPDSWGSYEWAMTTVGLIAVAVSIGDGHDPLLAPSDVLSLPGLPLLAAATVVLALLPTVISPGPRRIA